jgi:hypothetical protein
MYGPICADCIVKLMLRLSDSNVVLSSIVKDIDSPLELTVRDGNHAHPWAAVGDLVEASPNDPDTNGLSLHCAGLKGVLDPHWRP